MFNDEDLKNQLQRVLATVEQLLPKAIGEVDWFRTHAANWRRHSFAGYLDPVRQIVAKLSEESRITPEWNETLQETALKWSHDKSKRYGRTALQFSRYWVGQQLLKRSE